MLLTQVSLLGARHGSGCTALPVAGPTGLYSFSVAHWTHRVGLWNILFKRKQRWHNTTFCDVTIATGVWNLKQACWLVLPNYVRRLLIGPLVFILLILLMVNCHSLKKVFNLFKNLFWTMLPWRESSFWKNKFLNMTRWNLKVLVMQELQHKQLCKDQA